MFVYYIFIQAGLNQRFRVIQSITVGQTLFRYAFMLLIFDIIITQSYMTVQGALAHHSDNLRVLLDPFLLIQNEKNTF